MRTLLLAAAALLLTCTFAAAQETVTVTPGDNGELLANPNRGWETFHKSAAQDENLGEIPSTVRYDRYPWRPFETGQAEYDWSTLDTALREARAAGQTLAFRITTAGTGRPKSEYPDYLEELGCKIHSYSIYGGEPNRCPDFNDPVFIENHTRFIRALGERYNGRHGISHVDIGSIGLWGEWHMGRADVPMPTEENAKKIIDAYHEAFPDTPVVMQLDWIPGMKHARDLGMGWRVDCWGDMGGFSEDWSHMDDMYPRNIEHTGVEELWKRAPVALETCWDMRRWHREGWDVDRIFKWALDQHATFINNKSEPVPEDLLPKIRHWLPKVGYRFVVEKAAFPATAEPGGALAVEIDWKNAGVAPPYCDFHPAVALAGADGKVVWSHAVTSENAREWLPGEHSTNVEATLPEDLEAGGYDLLVALVDAEGAPSIRLPMSGRRDDNWHVLGEVAIEAK